MSKNINIFVTQLTTTGINVQFPQYEVDLRSEWIDNDGVPHSREETILFPNILNDSAISNAWLKENLSELLLKAARVVWGIDE